MTTDNLITLCTRLPSQGARAAEERGLQPSRTGSRWRLARAKGRRHSARSPADSDAVMLPRYRSLSAVTCGGGKSDGKIARRVLASVTRTVSAVDGPDCRSTFHITYDATGFCPPSEILTKFALFTVNSAHSDIEGAEWNVATSALSIPVRRDGGEAVARLLNSDARLRPLAARRSGDWEPPKRRTFRRSPPSQPSVAALRPRRQPDTDPSLRARDACRARSCTIEAQPLFSTPRPLRQRCCCCCCWGDLP